MPKNKFSFWSEFEEIADPYGKKRYKCKYCNSEWAKNTTRLQQHLSSCFARKIALESVNPESEPTIKQPNKYRQSVLDNYMFSFTKDQKELESLLVHAFYNTGIPFNIIENNDFQAFLQKAYPSFQILSYHILSGNLLNKEYKDLKKVVQNVGKIFK